MESHDLDLVDSLDELLQVHVRRLADQLDGGLYTVDSLEAELRAIDVIIATVKRRDQWLAELLDAQTPEADRTLLMDTLKAQRLILSGNQRELMVLRAKSQALLETSVRLVAESKERVAQLYE